MKILKCPIIKKRNCVVFYNALSGLFLFRGYSNPRSKERGYKSNKSYLCPNGVNCLLRLCGEKLLILYNKKTPARKIQLEPFVSGSQGVN